MPFREAIIYALSVGVSTEDTNGLRLRLKLLSNVDCTCLKFFSRFLYEDHPQFGPLPTFGVIPAMSGTDGLVTGGVPGLEIDLTQVTIYYRQLQNCFQTVFLKTYCHTTKAATIP